MTVVRELIARLGFQVDGAGFAAAERAVVGIKTVVQGAGTGLQATARQFGATNAAAAAAAKKGDEAAKKTEKAAKNTENALGTLGKLAATVGLTHVLKSMVEMASDANETSNILKELFGERGRAEIETWSEEMATAMGRSKFDLQSYAGRLGAVLEPMVKNRDKAQEMSTTLAGLAVDLGSFFNATDEDAMAALRSGLTGEYESLKRFGVVLNDVTLADFARTQGIKKKVTAMTNAEKTELRYRFILDQTKTAQGDAARTSDGYANATKALKAGLKDLGTEMGMTVIPVLEKVVRFARDGITRFKKFAQNTSLLKSAMLVLAGVAAWLAATLAAPFVVPALAVAGLILLVDDLNQLFSGGRSLIGEWLDELGGIGTADETVQTLRDTFQAVIDKIADLRARMDLQGAFELIRGSIEDVGVAVDLLGKKLLNLTTGPLRAMFNVVPDLLNLLGADVPRWEAELTERAAGRGVNAPLLTGIGEQIAQRRQQREEAVQQATVGRRSAAAATTAQRQVDETLAAEDAVQSRQPGESEAAGMSIDPAFAANRVQFGRARVSATEPMVSAPAVPKGGEAASTGSGTPNMSVVVQGNTVNVNGGDTNAVRRVVTDVLESQRRKSMAAYSGG